MQVVITTTNNTFHFLTGTPNYNEEQNNLTARKPSKYQ